MEPRINLERLRRNIEELAAFGRQPDGGITRESFSKADRDARNWLVKKIEKAGIQPRTDEAGNVFGRIGPEGAVIMAGSHLDTVPSGGRFDGALGVLAAFECLQTINECELPIKHPIEMVAFSDEEGAYTSFLGSRSLTGTLDLEEISKARHMDGKFLKDAMAESGMDINKVGLAKKGSSDVTTYLELHVEQGPQLDHKQIPIGIVRSIVGLIWYWITFTGEANHAGTTPMDMRKDAFLGAADFSLRVNDHVAFTSGGVVTVGDSRLSPGAFNIVPGKACLALEFRHSSADELRKMESDILTIGKEVAGERGLNFISERLSYDAPVLLSNRIQGILQKEAIALGYPFLLMDSGAAHDAQVLATETEAGMIFIPSIGGKSHCPEENSAWEDVQKGAQLLLKSLLTLAGEDQVGP